MNCKSCGASTHHFALKCVFCGSVIEKQEEDLTSETIVSNLTLWLGRLKESKGKDIEINQSGKNIKFSIEDMFGITRQYLGVLALRLIVQPELTSLYNQFKREMEVEIPAYHQKYKRKEWIFVIGVGVIAIIIYAGALIGRKLGWF